MVLVKLAGNCRDGVPDRLAGPDGALVGRHRRRRPRHQGGTRDPTVGLFASYRRRTRAVVTLPADGDHKRHGRRAGHCVGGAERAGAGDRLQGVLIDCRARGAVRSGMQHRKRPLAHSSRIAFRELFVLCSEPLVKVRKGRNCILGPQGQSGAFIKSLEL
jgi:hypothetical protein